MVKIIAEIGLNYAYGKDRSRFLDNAKKLIDVAVVAGCNWVKFQKRNPDICVPEEQKSTKNRNADQLNIKGTYYAVTPNQATHINVTTDIEHRSNGKQSNQMVEGENHNGSIRTPKEIRNF